MVFPQAVKRASATRITSRKSKGVVDLWENIITYASGLSCLLALGAMLIKPIREHILGITEMRDGQLCLLRTEIVRIYYRHLEDKTLREYEYENLCACYLAYRRGGGNSFVKHIYDEMQEWTIVR